MTKRITRRRMLAGSAAVPAVFATARCTRAKIDERVTEHPEFLSPWSPPTGLKKDLTPGSTPIRLASWSSSTTLDYRRDRGISIAEIVKRIRDHGYTSGNATIRRSIWYEATDSEIRELKEALTTYDVTFFDMHTTGSNIHPDPAAREKVYRYTVESCEAAERLGCVETVTSHTGNAGYGPAYYFSPDNWTWETWRKSVAAMKKILSDTAGMTVPIAIEATNQTAMNGPRPHLQLIEECNGDPRMKVCLDPVNMMNLSRYGRSTELIEECFELLGDHIVSAHAKDSMLQQKMSIYMEEVPPGQGVLDYETYLVLLSRLNQPITLLIEHIPDDQYAGAKKYIEDTAARLGVTIYGVA